MTDALALSRIDPELSPFAPALLQRADRYEQLREKLLQVPGSLSEFANGYLYFGIHRTEDGWVYREWAPHAAAAALVGDFNGWNTDAHRMQRLDGGVWELKLPPQALHHLDLVRVRFFSDGAWIERIPAYMERVVQSWSDGSFSGQIWAPERPFVWTDGSFFRKCKPMQPLIYECHIGMANEEERIGTYVEFTEKILPRIRQEGYNCIQIMAVLEHPYYASFGYQVSGFFAPSSRFGTPDELRALIDAAHGMGISVLLDLVHSHLVSNTAEGLSAFDGTREQYCTPEEHSAWGTRLFDYGKDEVLHFLLSNCKYWLECFHFDGFRFDGVTSMLYHDHGLGVSFDRYEQYFSDNTNAAAVTYLQLANELIHSVNPVAITIAEDMSGMPGLCLPLRQGGLGFDYRLSMGVPDFWIRTLREQRDEDWDIGRLWKVLTDRRAEEKTIGYCESHDQALVGDKTIMFRLADADMYWHMQKKDNHPRITRAMDYHKLIRLVTAVLAGEGYLNFMGNEFGHPEWIDFPREGNGNSGFYARRQWSLADNPELKYGQLLRFDEAMLKLLRRCRILSEPSLCDSCREQALVCRRGDIVMALNFHPTQARTLALPATAGELLLSTDAAEFGGEGRRIRRKNTGVTLPPRTAVVYARTE